MNASMKPLSDPTTITRPRGGAVLARVAHRRARDDPCGPGGVRVIEHDRRVLAAHLALHRDPARAGASDDGLRSTALPQHSAGVAVQSGIASGVFHGVISPTTPCGLRWV
jgi:hypothetical protein